jgi:hypothetical protein
MYTNEENETYYVQFILLIKSLKRRIKLLKILKDQILN